MNSGNWAQLVRLSLRRDRKGAIFSAFGVTIGVGALVFFVALGLGVGKVIREKVFPVDARLVEVIPPQLSLGLFGGNKLDQSTVERLSAIPGVETVFRKMNVRAPAASRYNGDFFGSRLSVGVDIFMVGVEPGFVKGDVLMGEFKDPGPDQPIPALVSSRLLEIYNKSFAPTRKLPQLSGQMVTGFMFPLEFNRSFMTLSPSGPVIPARAQIVGVSDRAPLEGVTVPLDVAIRMNKATGQDAESYTALSVVAKDPSAVPRIVEEAKKMGFQIDDRDRKQAENAGAAVALTTSALALLSILICVLAAVNIAHALSASVRARAKEIGVMRAVGASRSDIRNLILGEAAATGFLGGVAGTVLAVAAAFGIDAFAKTYLPEFPFKPESFFSFPIAVVAGGVLLGMLAAVVGAWFPSRHAAALDPARTLAG
ncbi:MAG: ABC transporter permease [Myxococcaceae bacterium]